MWFKKSSVQLSAAAILALTTRNYMTAGIFFALGVVERMEENEEEKKEKERSKREKSVGGRLHNIQLLLGEDRIGRDTNEITGIWNNIQTLGDKLRDLSKTVKSLKITV